MVGENYGRGIETGGNWVGSKCIFDQKVEQVEIGWTEIVITGAVEMQYAMRYQYTKQAVQRSLNSSVVWGVLGHRFYVRHVFKPMLYCYSYNYLTVITIITTIVHKIL